MLQVWDRIPLLLWTESLKLAEPQVLLSYNSGNNTICVRYRINERMDGGDDGDGDGDDDNDDTWSA